MTKEEKIINYIESRGMHISKYIDDFRHVVAGTVCIVSISMIKVYGGNIQDWWKLMEILNTPDCPIRMVPVKSSEHEIKGAFNRLIWVE